MNASASLSHRKYVNKAVKRPVTPEIVIHFNDAAGCWMAVLEVRKGLGAHQTVETHEYLATHYREPGQPMPMIHFIQDVFNGDIIVKVQL